jgi:hypothetical protein
VYITTNDNKTPQCLWISREKGALILTTTTEGNIWHSHSYNEKEILITTFEHKIYSLLFRSNSLTVVPLNSLEPNDTPLLPTKQHLGYLRSPSRSSLLETPTKLSRLIEMKGNSTKQIFDLTKRNTSCCSAKLTVEKSSKPIELSPTLRFPHRYRIHHLSSDPKRELVVGAAAKNRLYFWSMCGENTTLSSQKE